MKNKILLGLLIISVIIFIISACCIENLWYIIPLVLSLGYIGMFYYVNREYLNNLVEKGE